MKTHLIILNLSLYSLISGNAFAEKFSSFKKDQFYVVEGRFFSSKGKYLFKINEGNANEESLIFSANPHELANKVKYKICFKIKNDCQLNCEAKTERMIKTLAPWEEAKPIIPRGDGSYVESSEIACKESL